MAVVLALALEAGTPRITVVLLGGTLRPLQLTLLEPMASLILEQINVHTLVLGCNGVDPDGGVTNVNLPEAEVKRKMLKAARRVVVVADGSKIGRVELATLCPVEHVDLLLTGESADPVVVERLRRRGLDVRVVR
jgi:DeoR family transcriptional regulator of aga operon